VLKRMVGPCGLEPQTSTVSRWRSSQLSYGPSEGVNRILACPPQREQDAVSASSSAVSFHFLRNTPRNAREAAVCDDLEYRDGEEDLLGLLYSLRCGRRPLSTTLVGNRRHDPDSDFQLVGGLPQRLVLILHLCVSPSSALQTQTTSNLLPRGL
jgi:hypothetical protein